MISRSHDCRILVPLERDFNPKCISTRPAYFFPATLNKAKKYMEAKKHNPIKTTRGEFLTVKRVGNDQ